MEAYILLTDENAVLTREQILSSLKEKGVVSGINEEAIKELGNGKVEVTNIILRKGNNPRNRGHISAGKMGKIVGGITQAGQKLEVYDLGNKARLRTEVYVGREDKYINDKNQLVLQMKSVGKELSLLRSAYQNFQKRYMPEERNVNPMYLKVEDAIYTKELEMKEIQKKDVYLDEEIEKSKHAKLIVKGTIYQGVKIDVNGARWFSDEVTNVTVRKTDERVALYTRRSRYEI